MKPIPRITYKLLAHSAAAVVLSISALASGTAADDTVVQTSGGVTYVSGGVGSDSIDRLTALTGNFNLKLVFALNSGVYVSDVRVAIADTTGRALLNATSDGPWFLTKLPAGNYQIVATFAGTAVTRQVAVGTARLSTVDMRWASE